MMFEIIITQQVKGFKIILNFKTKQCIFAMLQFYYEIRIHNYYLSDNLVLKSYKRQVMIRKVKK